ncbi:MAG: DUF115 domain-containing protein [Thermoplasmata archaeon]|nr:DUF115 domain-containing protein [Thermoplasmata archaeon]
MQYARWAPQYARIAEAFGFDLAREAAAADRLRSLLPPPALERPLERCAERIIGREAVVVGLAPEAGAPPLHLLAPTQLPRVVLAADGATARCLAGGIVPDLVVTDLDGPVASEVNANVRGALTVVHAHADNVEAMERWVPEFSGALAGSWAGPPTPALLDAGGFTDGERAAFLAAHVGATRVLLWGFDFDRPDGESVEERETKRRKLAFARQDLLLLVSGGGPPIDEWRRDGSLRPFQAETAERSTQ